MKRLLLLALVAAACGSPKPKPALPVETPPEPPVAVTPPPAPVNPDTLPLPLWSEIHKGTLANGLTYYVLPHHKPEKRAMMWLAVNAGSVDEDDDQRGLAHFDEHMAFNGTKRFPKDALIRYLESIGMKFGADLNAYTTWQQTVYQLEVPTDDAKFIGSGMDILRDWAGDVTYDPHEVQLESGVVHEEWRLGRGAFMRLFDKQAGVLFKGSRYADRITIGLEKTITDANRAALVRFYKDWYRPDQMAVIVVGEVDPTQIEAQIKAKFGDLVNPANERKKVVAGVPAATGTRISIETDKEVPTTSVRVLNLVPHRPNASRIDFRRYLVEAVYGAIVNERLDALRRKPDAPFLGAFTSIGGQTREIDAYTRSATVKAGRVEDALRAILTEALRVERFGFSQAELDRARATVQRNAEEGVARDATTDSREYTDEITRNFFENEELCGRVGELAMTKEMLPKITVEELDADVKTFGGAENRVITISGPEGKPLPAQDAVLAIVREVAGSTITKWEEKPIPTTLMPTLPTAGKIVKEKTLDPIGVTEWTLSNGIRVVVKPTDFEHDSLVVTGEQVGGTALVKDKDYSNARFATQAAAVGGLGEIDADTLGKVLNGKRAQATAFIGETSEGISASASPRDLETMFQLIHLRMTAPRKDPEQFAIWQTNSAQQLTDQMRSPEFQYFKLSAETLYNRNLRRSLPAPEDYAKVDLDKALAFYRARFGDASGFTFVIVGEVDLGKLRPLVETYLASLPAGKPHARKEIDLGIRKASGVVAKEWKLGVEPKASVRLDFHADDAWTRDKDRDVFVLGQVLNIRLREVLREDLGGVYGVGTGGSISRSPHQERTFTIQFGCDPKRVGELLAAAKKEIAAVAADKIIDNEGKPAPLADYLAKVKATFERGRETELRTNRFWLNRLSRDYHYGDDPLDIPDSTKLVGRMTPANVEAAAKHFLDYKQTYQAVRVPEEKK